QNQNHSAPALPRLAVKSLENSSRLRPTTARIDPKDYEVWVYSRRLLLDMEMCKKSTRNTEAQLVGPQATIVECLVMLAPVFSASPSST
ncbi:hypothetical protein JMJ78_0004248, partial [Colletotrichum scovillei]